MIDSTDTRSIVVERTMPHPLQTIWRALTQSSLSNTFRGWLHVLERLEQVAGTGGPSA